MSSLRQLAAIRPHGADRADDGELVAHARDGSGWAKGELFRRHAGRVTALLVRLLGSTADAEDAAQDAFVEAFRDLGQLREAAAFGGWLTQIAVRQAHRRFRKRRLLRALGLDRGASDATLNLLVDGDATPEVRAELRLVAKILDRMPAPERIAWSLRHVEGYELADVAASCGCSLATVKRRSAAAEERIAAAAARGDHER